MNTLIDITIKSFLNDLASNKPAPGGGSVAALAGSTAAALGAMVAKLTVESKKTASIENQSKLNTLATNFDSLKENLSSKIDEDTNAFNKVLLAFKLPKISEREREIRSSSIQDAYKNATIIPLETAKISFSVMENLVELTELGLTSTCSDIGTAFLMCFSSIESARFNVLINLSSVNDEFFVKQTRDDINTIQFNAKNLLQKNLIEIENKL